MYHRHDSELIEDLFRRTREGDERAFAELYDRLERPVLAFCLAITGEEDAARDAFQQTMITVYDGRHRYRDGNLLGWIYTIARNTSRSEERRRKRLAPIDDAGDLVVEQPSGIDSDEAALLQRAILQLPEEFRRVVVMRYFGDLSCDTIAELEDISTDLVKVRLFRARKRLATLLRVQLEPRS